MAFTSNWQWGEIDLREEQSRSYGANRTRANNTLIRFRYSDQPFTTQQGELATSVTAISSIGSETFEAPTRTDLVGWDTTTNWCTTSQVWIPTGQVCNGGAIYVPDTGNIPNANAVNVLFRCKIIDIRNGDEDEAYQWRVSEVGATDLPNIPSVETRQSDTTAYTYLSVTYGNRRYKPTSFNRSTGAYAGTDDGFTPFGITIGGSNLGNGQFSGSSTVVSASAQMSYLCTQDSRAFETNGATWYKQTQTWVYTEPWT